MCYIAKYVPSHSLPKIRCAGHADPAPADVLCMRDHRARRFTGASKNSLPPAVAKPCQISDNGVQRKVFGLQGSQGFSCIASAHLSPFPRFLPRPLPTSLTPRPPSSLPPLPIPTSPPRTLPPYRTHLRPSLPLSSSLPLCCERFRARAWGRLTQSSPTFDAQVSCSGCRRGPCTRDSRHVPIDCARVCHQRQIIA